MSDAERIAELEDQITEIPTLCRKYEARIAALEARLDELIESRAEAFAQRNQALRRIAELEAEVSEAMGFVYAYCATASMNGRAVHDIEAPEIVDAWDKAKGRKP